MPVVTASWYQNPLSPDDWRSSLLTHTVLDTDDVPHLVDGLSLEISRQADRIRRRSHSRDWPGAASAMTEMEEAVGLLSQLVNVSLRSSLSQPAPEPESVPEEPAAPEIGQYL